MPKTMMVQYQNPICSIPQTESWKYQSIYKSDYQDLKLASAKLLQPITHPLSPTRRNCPHPRRVFLFDRVGPELECKVWAPMDAKSISQILSATPLSNSQWSYKNPSKHPNFSNCGCYARKKPTVATGITPTTPGEPSHFLHTSTQYTYVPCNKNPPNFTDKPTRYRAAAKHIDSGVLPVRLEGHDLVLDNVKNKTKAKGPQSGYVLDVRMPIDSAVEDMKKRATEMRETWKNQTLTKPNRRKWLTGQKPSLDGSSMEVKHKTSNDSYDSILSHPLYVPSYHRYY